MLPLLPLQICPIIWIALPHMAICLTIWWGNPLWRINLHTFKLGNLSIRWIHTVCQCQWDILNILIQICTCLPWISNPIISNILLFLNILMPFRSKKSLEKIKKRPKFTILGKVGRNNSQLLQQLMSTNKVIAGILNCTTRDMRMAPLESFLPASKNKKRSLKFT